MPDFIQAKFSEAPRFDNLYIRPAFVEPGGFWVLPHQDVKKQIDANPDLQNVPARWRALKRLAIQGHDHIREQEFFANEIRSAQFVTDWPYGEGWPRFWFGKLYQWFSDFGRSIVRPLAWWAAIAAICFCIYLDEYRAIKAQGPLHILNCVTNDVLPKPRVPLADGIRKDLTAVNEALWLTFGNGLVVGNLIGGTETTRLMYGCLYGLEEIRPPAKSNDHKSAKPNTSHAGLTVTYIPPFVAKVSAFQRFASVIFIFLFGLAIRNMLKMK